MNNLSYILKIFCQAGSLLFADIQKFNFRGIALHSFYITILLLKANATSPFHKIPTHKLLNPDL